LVFEGIEKRQVFQGIAALLKCCQILSRHIVTLPTQPSAEVEIGIAAPKRENRSPAAEQFLRYALDHLPEPSPVSFRPKRKTEWE